MMVTIFPILVIECVCHVSEVCVMYTGHIHSHAEERRKKCEQLHSEVKSYDDKIIDNIMIISVEWRKRVDSVMTCLCPCLIPL